MKDKPREKCGVIGVYTGSTKSVQFIRQALASLQHRGQESAGISILGPKNKIITYKNNGLVPHVLTESVLKKLGRSKVAIGHNRYSTSGSGAVQNAQPFELKLGKYQIAIGHNGNIPDVSNLRKRLGNVKTIKSDTFLAASLLLQERPHYDSWEKTLMATLPEFRGAYNFVILTNDGDIFGMRDPYGIRPLCLGKLHDGWMVASESVALDSVGAHYVRDIKPGEIIKLAGDGTITSYFFGEPKRPQYCLFEYVYFSRPDSYINEKRVRFGRELSGKFLGERIVKKGIKPDLIIPTFDSGYPAAKGVAEELKLRMVDAITTSHYVGRTFIQPGQDNRTLAVSGKHNIIPDEIQGKKVVIVDDSAVRMTTSKSLIQGLKDAGAKEVYLAIASPPVVDQCDLGIDMRSKKDLPAAKFVKHTLDVIEKNIAQLIGADGVIYLPIEDTTRAMGGTPKDFYHTPFGGPHPIRGKQEVFAKRKKPMKEKIKIAVFVSGNGTNLQKVIDEIEAQTMEAEIVCVLSNNPDAYGLKRATKHNIPAVSLPYEGKLKDKDARHDYEIKLVKEMEKFQPDMILLSGWMFVLSDYFVKQMQTKEIPVINHHWSLLTKEPLDVVWTSRGKIPVFRGHHGFKETFEANVPVGGITVHQILPEQGFDEGPIVMKAEVRRKPTDTIESWESRNRAMEYLLVPSALKRIIHVLKHNIDISKGTFPW